MSFARDSQAFTPIRSTASSGMSNFISACHGRPPHGDILPVVNQSLLVIFLLRLIWSDCFNYLSISSPISLLWITSDQLGVCQLSCLISQNFPLQRGSFTQRTTKRLQPDFR